jgi:DNA-binding response OmpR family regulator
MSLSGGRSGIQGKVMVVDDTPANLHLLEEILEAQGYEVRSFARGRLALRSAQLEAPDLFLLDVNMPELDGYEVCRQLKAIPRLCDIPVIFISALDATEDKVKGFAAGGADYIAKPFQIEEVQARVETHLTLRHALQAERDLLERTLSGASTILLQFVHITSPTLVLRSHCIRHIVHWVTRKLELAQSWQYELAATLSLVGCVAMSNELFERAYGGQRLTHEEEQIFRAHPEAGARLVSNIPRLESVAEIIRLQQTPRANPCLAEELRTGAELLHLAIELDQRIYRDLSFHAALAQLRDPRFYRVDMLDALSDYAPAAAPFDLRQIAIREVMSGMILDEDIKTTGSRILLFRSGLVFTDLWIQRLRNFARTHGIQEHIRVRIPRLDP